MLLLCPRPGADPWADPSKPTHKDSGKIKPKGRFNKGANKKKGNTIPDKSNLHSPKSESKITGNGAGENTTNITSPGMKGVLLTNEEGLNSSGENADAGTGNGCAGVPGMPQEILGRGEGADKSREEPGRTQELGGSWGSREEREKHKCGLERN